MDAEQIDVVGYIFGQGDGLTWLTIGILTAVFLFSIIVNRKPKK
jgi:K+-transporting ATPase A subunit